VDAAALWRLFDMIGTIAFAVFRFFDAVKPPPIKWFDQRVSGGLGVMLDDLIAAVFSIAVVWVLVGLS